MPDVVSGEFSEVLSIFLYFISDSGVGFVNAGELSLGTIVGIIDDLKVSLKCLHCIIEGVDVGLKLCYLSLMP